MSPRPWSPPTLPLLILGLALIGGSSGCGESGPASPIVPRPSPGGRLLLAVETAPEAVVRSFAVPDELEAWTIEAPSFGVERLQDGEVVADATSPPPPGATVTRWLRLVGKRDSAAIRIARAGSYDATEFDQVRVTLTSSGAGTLQAQLLGDGEVVARSLDVELPREAARLEVHLDLVPLGDPGRSVDTVALTCEGGSRDIAVETVALAVGVQGGIGAGQRLVSLDRDERRGVTIAPGYPAFGDFLAPAGGRLAFAFGRVAEEEAAPPTSPITLHVSLSDEDGTFEEKRLSIPGPTSDSPWRIVRLDLGSAERPVRAHFAAEGTAGPGEPPVVLAVAEATAYVPRADPPTVLLVTTDTHRGDHLGSAGRGVAIRTPALDALAATGVNFRNCFSPITSTNPSHVALMTGVHPRDTGVVDNRAPLQDAAPTLAEVFQDAGWATAAVLSTRHLGPEGSGLGQGFDRVDSPKRPRDSADTVAIASSWLADVADRPLFLWVHVFDAHAPYEPPPDLDRLDYEGDPFDPSLPPLAVPDSALERVNLAGVRDLAYPRAQYRAEITSLDRDLGRLLDEPRLADAVVAVVGDHGESLGHGDIYFEHSGLHTDSIHVPLLLRWPDAPAGSVVEVPVMHLDLGATLLDLADVTAPDHPGRSLASMVGNASAPARPRFLLHANAHAAGVEFDGLLLIIHLRDWQNVRSARAFAHHEVELFDLTTDWACEHNLVDERPEQAAQLRQRVVDWLADARASTWVGAITEDAAAVEQLTALGYLDGPARDEDASLWEPDDCAWCARFR